MKKMKKAGVLVSAIATTAVCASMIAGSTFALFTSEDQVDITVSSGTVAVSASIEESSLVLSSMGEALQGSVWENGGTAGFNDKAEFILNNITPGDSASFNIKAVNESNVNIRYRLNWAVSGELAEVLEANAQSVEFGTWENWVIPTNDAEKVKNIAVTVSLPETVGNEYQNKSATIVFSVEAVQGNVSDETLTDWDMTVVTLDNVLSNDNGYRWFPSGDIKLGESLDLGTDSVALNNPKLKLNGKTVTCGEAYVSPNSTVEIYGGIIKHSEQPREQAMLGQYALCVWGGANLTLRDVTVQATNYKSGNYANNYHALYIDSYHEDSENSAIVVIEGNSILYGNIDLQGDFDNPDLVTYLTIRGGEFFYEGYEDAYFSSSYSTRIVVEGGIFHCKKLANVGTDLVVTGGTFECDPSAWVDGELYDVIETDGIYTVVAK